MSTQGTTRSGQLLDVAHGVWDVALVTAAGGAFGIGSNNTAAAGDTATATGYDGLGNPDVPLFIPGGSQILSIDVVQEVVTTQAAGAGNTVQIFCGANSVGSPAVGDDLGASGANFGWPAFIEGVAAGIAGGFPGTQNCFVAAASALTLTVAGAAVTTGRLHVYVTYIQANI